MGDCRPAQRQESACTPTPRIGGVAISASMFVVLVPLLLFTNIITLHDVLDHSRLTTLLGSAFFIAMVGLADDVLDLPATYKLIALLAAARRLRRGCEHSRRSAQQPPLPGSGPRLVAADDAVDHRSHRCHQLHRRSRRSRCRRCRHRRRGPLDQASRFHSDPVVAVLCVCLVGSLSGFLIYNFHPAKIFMGDSGSMFIGYMLAASSLMCAVHSTTTTGIIVPALGCPSRSLMPPSRWSGAWCCSADRFFPPSAGIFTTICWIRASLRCKPCF